MKSQQINSLKSSEKQENSQSKKNKESTKDEKEIANQWILSSFFFRYFFFIIYIDAKCWIAQNESQIEPFLPATIHSYDLTKGIIKYKLLADKSINEIADNKIFKYGDENEKSIEDMVNIECLNDAELLENIKKRFLIQNTIFTYVGPTLLIVNPYKYIDELFNMDTLALYQKQINNPNFTLKDAPSHIYAISAELFKQLFEFKKNQALVISGESGAGKTENTKYAMKFLTSLGQNHNKLIKYFF